MRPVEVMGRCSLAGLGLGLGLVVVVMGAVMGVVRAEEDSLTGGLEGDSGGTL